MELDNDQSVGMPEASSYPLLNGLVDRRDAERQLRLWELPGVPQDAHFINKRIDNAKQPFTIFDIIKDQQQSLTGANLTAAFVKLVNLTTVDNVKHGVRSHRVFKEMMLTAAQNSQLFSDEELAQIIWALVQLDAEPPVNVMDTFMCNFYSRMDKVDIRVLSKALWGMARLDYIPAEKVLIRACQSMAERLRLREGRLSDFCSCFWALAVMGYCPVTSILHDLVALGCSCLGSLTPMEVGQMLWSFIQFGFHPGQTFLDVVDALFCGAECMWKLEETSMLFWGMATYAYPLNQLFIFQSIEKVQSALPNCSWPVLLRVLGGCARMCYHPGKEFLQAAATFLASVVDEIYYEAIETVLWSYATFSFHPGVVLLNKLVVKTTEQLNLFSALHLANIVWCYALFDDCKTEGLASRVWQSLSDALLQFPLSDIPPEALYRLFQTYLLKSDSTGDGLNLPRDLKEAGMDLWKSQMDTSKDIQSPFHKDVLRMLSMLQLNSPIVQNFWLPNGMVCIGFYFEHLHKGLELIDEHEFTINTTEPIGSAIMRTKIVQSALGDMPSSFSLEYLKHTDWQSLRSDSDKLEFLKRIFKV